jgi:hypothetical protein
LKPKKPKKNQKTKAKIAIKEGEAVFESKLKIIFPIVDLNYLIIYLFII